MGRKTKELSSLNDEDVVVGVRIPNSLARSLDLLKEKRGTNRSIEIIRGIDFIISAEECPQCHTLNASGSKFCSNCQISLNEDKKIVKHILDTYGMIKGKLSEIQSYLEVLEDRHSKIQWLIEKQKPDTQKQIELVYNPLNEVYLEIIKSIQDPLTEFESLYDEKNYSKLISSYPHHLYEKKFFENDPLIIAAALQKLYESGENSYFYCGFTYERLLKLDYDLNYIINVKLDDLRKMLKPADDILNNIESGIDKIIDGK